MSDLRHLTRRFFGSLWPGGPGAKAEAWVGGLLLPGEVQLWRRLGGPDRRHAVGVARAVEARLAPAQASRPVLAAALLHDIGKLASGLGTCGRVIATIAGRVTRGTMVLPWTNRSGFVRKVGLYLNHARLGADMLALAGSEALTVAWAREHHEPPETWTVAPELAAVLKAADDD
jgi:HD domain